MVTLPFRNRDDAACQLALALDRWRGADPLVLAIPRGAVPMGKIVAERLGGDLDVVLVKKIGAPGNPEFAIGSVDEQGAVELDDAWGDDDADLDYARSEAARQLATLRARRARYRADGTPISATGRVAIVVDDGLATGSTMRAALRAVRRQRPRQLVCAVPVASTDALASVRPLADATVCLATPHPFIAVGPYYEDFGQVDDATVAALLGAREPASG